MMSFVLIEAFSSYTVFGDVNLSPKKTILNLLQILLVFRYTFMHYIDLSSICYLLIPTFNVDIKMYLEIVLGLSRQKFMLVLREKRKGSKFWVALLFYTILVLVMDFGIIFHVLEVVFIQWLDLQFFSTFPLNLLRSKIMNKSMLDRMKGFSFRELLVDFKLEQSFRSVTCKLLINLHTTGCRPHEYIHGP